MVYNVFWMNLKLSITNDVTNIIIKGKVHRKKSKKKLTLLLFSPSVHGKFYHSESTFEIRSLCNSIVHRVICKSTTRDDEALYWVSIGHYEAVAVGNC